VICRQIKTFIILLYKRDKSSSLDRHSNHKFRHPFGHLVYGTKTEKSYKCIRQKSLSVKAKSSKNEQKWAKNDRNAPLFNKNWQLLSTFKRAYKIVFDLSKNILSLAHKLLSVDVWFLMSKRSGDSPDFGELSRAVADSIFDTKCMSSIPKILRYCDYIKSHIGLRARGGFDALWIRKEGRVTKDDRGQMTEDSRWLSGDIYKISVY